MSTYDLAMHPQADNLSLDDLHLSAENQTSLSQLLNEFKYFDALKAYNLPINNKILLHGHTGCGKTTTARAIAKAINKKIIILNLGNIISSRLGETAKNITRLFDKATKDKSILFIDEFDYIGKMRDANPSDSGEMKRVVNAIIQLIDYLPSDTLLIAATNHLHQIDAALIRRFQLRLQFEKPNKEALDHYYSTLLAQYPLSFRDVSRHYDISYAEAKDNILTAVKQQIIKSEILKDQSPKV